MRDRIESWLNTLRRNVAALRKRPDRIGPWLLRARSAQIALVVLVPVLLFAVPPVLDRALNARYSDVKVESKFLGFIPHERSEANPVIPVRRRQLLTLAWLLGGATVSVLLGRGLPGALAQPTRQIDPTGRYRIDRLLARGGMGVVYRAQDTVLDRPIALKELPLDTESESDLAERFTIEAKALARLTHPNIVQVYDLLEESRHLWMAIELVEGGTLATLLEQRGQVPPEETARIGAEIARGLEFAHSKGIVHRDIKPTNVLLAHDGTPKIADFGIAKLMGETTRTVDGSIVGSPHYMSPEQASGRPVDERSDIYSLGVLLYEMLTGERPFQGDVVSLISQHVSRQAPRVSQSTDEVPQELDELVARMMAKDPTDRPENMALAAKELAAFA